MRRSFIRTLVPIAAIALIAAGCSDDDDGGGDIGARRRHRGARRVARRRQRGHRRHAADTTTGDTAAGSTTPDSGEEVQTGESLLDTVQANDVVRCGVHDDLAGFAVVDEAGDYVGFDADFCRVIAAGVLGDATKVEFIPVATDARFPALQAGEIDVLVRNTTWTASRDGNDGATFLHPTFYDGQQMMVAADSGYTSIDDMDGAVVCVVAGTTTEGNVATEFAARGLTVDVQSFDDIDLVQEAFIAGQCDGWSSDGSQLASRRTNYPDGPDALVIFEDVFSKEPLTPAVIDGDTRWAQAVEWAIFATIQAEELGITSDDRRSRRHRRRRGEGAVPHGGQRRRHRARPRSRLGARLRPADRQPGRQLRRDLRRQPAGDRRRGARPERPVVRRRPAVRPAVPLTRR